MTEYEPTIKEKILAVAPGGTVILPFRELRIVVNALLDHPTESAVACAKEMIATGACRSFLGREIVFAPHKRIGTPVLSEATVAAQSIAPHTIPSTRISDAAISTADISPEDPAQ